MPAPQKADLHMYNELDFRKLIGFDFKIKKLVGFHLVRHVKVSALVLNLVSGFEEMLSVGSIKMDLALRLPHG